LKAPEATLLDPQGATIGTHFGGPSWKAKDGSIVVGELVDATPSPRTGAIPWLLLRAKTHEGSGEMADVDYIVRTNTDGGVAPGEGCDAAHEGNEIRVPYAATYLFFRG
jgi:hypothetical protein